MTIREHLSRLRNVLSSKRFGKARKVIVLVVGSLLLLVGVVLIFIPGPAFIVIPAGLALLATEFKWARRWLKTFREWVRKIRAKFRAARA